MFVPLHECKVPRWNGMDELEKLWKSPSWSLATVCPSTEKNDGEAVYCVSGEAEEAVKGLPRSVIEQGGFGARKLEYYEKVWERDIWMLSCRPLALTLAPSKRKWQRCILTDESELWVFVPLGQHLHLTPPSPLLSSFLVHIFLHIKINVLLVTHTSPSLFLSSF